MGIIAKAHGRNTPRKYQQIQSIKCPPSNEQAFQWVVTFVPRLSGKKTVYQLLLIGQVSKVAQTSVTFTSSLSVNMSCWVLLNLLSSVFKRSAGLSVDLTVVSALGVVPKTCVWLAFAGRVQFIILIKSLICQVGTSCYHFNQSHSIISKYLTLSKMTLVLKTVWSSETCFLFLSLVWMGQFKPPVTL